jgi:CDP-glycerol:poly(glycerophosphate) glycerophosphotransferase
MSSFTNIDAVGEAPIRQQCDTHIVFLLTHGFSARTVIRSGLGRRLIAQGARITVISPNADETYFWEECQTEGITLQQEPKNGGRAAQRFRSYRPYLLDDVLNNPALKCHHLQRCEDRPLVGCALEIVNRTVARSSLFRKLSRTLECKINRSKEVQELLTQLKPSLLVLPNPFGIEETVYLLHARELGIPIVCQMLSWDNITSKGTPLLMPDYFISWGPIMTQEMLDVYKFSRDKIYECGVSHFDVYSQQGQLIPRDALLSELNLPLQQPYIFYGMVAPYSCPNEIDMLTWLANKVNSNAFDEPCSLVIRPHPQTISGFYSRTSKELERLRALTGSRVALDTPSLLSERLAWDLPKSDMYRLASLLAGSAMCINANSTLCLDACMLDRPVINIAFDGLTELPYEKSARRGLDYFHMAKLLALGGIRIARSFSDLEDHINTYLRDPDLDRQGRMLSVAQECGPRDGRAVERVANTLLQLADRRQRPPLQLTTHSNSSERSPLL